MEKPHYPHFLQCRGIELCPRGARCTMQTLKSPAKQDLGIAVCTHPRTDELTRRSSRSRVRGWNTVVAVSCLTNKTHVVDQNLPSLIQVSEGAQSTDCIYPGFTCMATKDKTFPISLKQAHLALCLQQSAKMPGVGLHKISPVKWNSAFLASFEFQIDRLDR